MLKALIYVVAAVFMVIFGMKHDTGEEDMDIDIDYDDIQPQADDEAFLESMKFSPYWADMKDGYLIVLKDSLLLETHAGQDLSKALEIIKAEHPDNEVEYLRDVLNGLYHDEVNVA